MTSSGLTHSCTDGGIPGFVCRGVWRRFAAHRLPAGDAELAALPPQHFIGKNFGAIDIAWGRGRNGTGGGAPAFNVTVYDANGRAALHVRRAARGAERPALAALLPPDVLPLDAALGATGSFVAALLVALLFGALGAAWWAAPRRRSRRAEPPHAVRLAALADATAPATAPATARVEPRALRYFSHDFEWAECAAARHDACEGAAAPLITPPSANAPLPLASATWDAFYAQQGATFYKVRTGAALANVSCALSFLD